MQDSAEVRRGKLLLMGMRIVEEMIKIRGFMGGIGLGTLDAYIEEMRARPKGSQEEAEQAEFLLDNLLALRAYMTQVEEINDNAKRSGLFLAGDADVAQRILDFGLAPGSDKKQ